MSSPPPFTKFVLIVHDDPEVAAALECYLDGVGLESVVSRSKAEARQFLEEDRNWDLCIGCIIDMKLQEVDIAGLRLAQRIREREQQKGASAGTRKLLVGITAHEDRMRLFVDGIFDVGFQAPVAPQKLVELLCSTLKSDAC